jgi:hypothetical protein
MAAQGFAVDEISLTIDADGSPVEVNCAVTGVTWDTGDAVTQWQTACPDGYGSGVVKGPQTLGVEFVVDYSTDSLTRILDEHAGATASVVFTPDSDVPGYQYGGDVILQRGSQTYSVGSVAAQSASWPCVGVGLQPIITP